MSKSAIGDWAYDDEARYLEGRQESEPMMCETCCPHGPDERCTCNGCWACAGRVVGCTCDIAWDCDHVSGLPVPSQQEPSP